MGVPRYRARLIGQDFEDSAWLVSEFPGSVQGDKCSSYPRPTSRFPNRGLELETLRPILNDTATKRPRVPLGWDKAPSHPNPTASPDPADYLLQPVHRADS